jgi:hypothetical protein
MLRLNPHVFEYTASRQNSKQILKIFSKYFQMQVDLVDLLTTNRSPATD